MITTHQIPVAFTTTNTNDIPLNDRNQYLQGLARDFERIWSIHRDEYEIAIDARDVNKAR